MRALSFIKYYHTSNLEECEKSIYDYYLKYNNKELKYCGKEFADEYFLKHCKKLCAN